MRNHSPLQGYPPPFFYFLACAFLLLRAFFSVLCSETTMSFLFCSLSFFVVLGCMGVIC
ncbi:hypothetical protein DFJ73DRAFT_838663, partial [Zopfochytrium polystomum]